MRRPLTTAEAAVRAQQIRCAFEKMGWRFLRREGGFIIFTRAGSMVSIPNRRMSACRSPENHHQRDGHSICEFHASLKWFARGAVSSRPCDPGARVVQTHAIAKTGQDSQIEIG
jgi:hypothetical protein